MASKHTGPAAKSGHDLHSRLGFAKAYGAWYAPGDSRPRCPGCEAVLVMPWCIWCDGTTGHNPPEDLASALRRSTVLEDLSGVLVAYFHGKHGRDKGTELLLKLMVQPDAETTGPDYGPEAETAWECARDLEDQEATS
jgi:hypothetical protein